MRFNLLISAVVIVMHWRNKDGYSSCPFNFGRWMFAGWVDMLVISVGVEFLDSQGCFPIGVMLLFYGVSASLVIFPTLQVMMIMLQSRRETSCMPNDFKFLNTFVIYFTNAVILLFGCTFGCWFICHLIHLRKLAQLQSEFDTVYDKVLDPKFDLDGFLERHKDSLAELPFSNRDSALLTDICGRKYGKDQSDVPENDKDVCAICLSTFEAEEQMMDLPGCKHIFHNECVLRWFDQPGKKPQCPNCKHDVRPSLFQQVSAMRKEKGENTQQRLSNTESPKLPSI